MIDQLIISCLTEKGKITVPAFGTFFMNNSEVMFLTYLNTDDGELREHLTRKLSVSPDMASEILDSYIDTIANLIETNGSYIFGNYGKLKRDANNLLHLEVNEQNAQSQLIDIMTYNNVEAPESCHKVEASAKQISNSSLVDFISKKTQSTKTLADCMPEKKKF